MDKGSRKKKIRSKIEDSKARRKAEEDEGRAKRTRKVEERVRLERNERTR